MAKVDRTKEQKIADEIRQLKKIYKDMGANRTALAGRLIEKAAFLKISTDELQATINAEGYVSEYKNGENQYGTKKSPEAELFTAWIKNYQSVIESLIKLLPDKAADDATEDIMSFITKPSAGRKAAS